MADEITSGLARILSNEPLPSYPVLQTQDKVEMENFIRALFVYLKRLFGRFTATNIATTLTLGGQGTFIEKVSKTVKFNRVGDGLDYDITLDESDWREYLIVMASGNQYDTAPLVSTVTGTDSVVEETDTAPAAAKNLLNIPGNVPTCQIFVDGTDGGKLKLRLNDGGGGPYTAIPTHVVLCVVAVERLHSTPDYTIL